MFKHLPLVCLLFISQASADVLDEMVQAYKQENYDSIEEMLSTVEAKSYDHYRVLVSAQLETDIDEAEETAEEMVAAAPKNANAQLLYASVMGSQASNGIFGAMGYAKKAKKALEQAIALEPNNIDALNGLFSFHLAAPSIAGGDKEEALRLVGEIKQIDNLQGQIAEAQYSMFKDEAEQAETALKQLLEDDKTKPDALIALANLYRQQDDNESALSHYQQAIALVEKDTNDDVSKLRMNANYQFARIAIDTPEFHEAAVVAMSNYIQEYETTSADVIGMPSLSWARLRLAELMLKTGQIEQAKALMTQLKKLDDSRFKKIQKRLNKKLRKA